MGENGWSEHQRLVIDSLERHDRYFDKLFEKIDGMGKEIATLKVKAGIWGGLAGIVSAIASMILLYIKSSK